MNERIPDSEKTQPLTAEGAPSPKKQRLGEYEADIDAITESAEASRAAIAKRVREKFRDIYPDIQNVTVLEVRQNQDGKIIWARGNLYVGGLPRGEGKHEFEVNM